MIEMIAIDLDGTLLTTEKKISSKTKEAILRAKEKGVKIVLCTGRPFPGVLPYLKELNLEEPGDYAITYNGALVQQTHDRKTIVHHALSFEDFLEIESMSRKVGVHCHTIDEKIIYTANKDISPYTIREAGLVNMPYEYRAAEDMDPSITISKMMMIDAPDILDRGIAQFPQEFLDNYTVLKSEAFYLEVLNKSANKGLALKDLAELLSIPKERIVAIGDNQNDIDMLEYAGTAIGMGNAIEDVKSVSDHITAANDDDGVAKALKYLNI